MSELSQPGSPEFLATVEKMRAEYEKLSATKLEKKIRHLSRAARRCSLPRNVDLMLAFQRAALDIVRDRRPHQN